MKVYCVWAYEQYYPTGPGDLQGVYASHEEAYERADYYQKHYSYDYVKVTEEEVVGEIE